MQWTQDGRDIDFVGIALYDWQSLITVILWLFLSKLRKVARCRSLM